MAHIIVPEAEALLDQELSVLDHGFVRLVDYFGGDLRIVQAARISYAKGAKDDDPDGNRKLIDYLMRNRHTSPFEQVVLTFHLKLPIFVMRQLVRHRTARLNEMSGRYTELPEECFVPDPDSIRGQDTKNKQGRTESVVNDAAALHDKIDFAEQDAFTTYSDLLEAGVARELARIVTPVATYTQCYWQIDLHNLFHFLSLRLDPHAQAEIRVYAEQMARCAQAVAPMAFDAWLEHVQGSMTFSRSECRALRRLFEGYDSPLNGRRAEEFEAKLHRVMAD